MNGAFDILEDAFDGSEICANRIVHLLTNIIY